MKNSHNNPVIHQSNNPVASIEFTFWFHVLFNRVRKWLQSVLLVVMILATPELPYAQSGEEEQERVPKEQLAVEERKTGDSFVENLGELPGKIATLPLKIFFKGVSKVAGFVDYHHVVLRVTDVLTNEDGTRKVRPVFAPFSGAGLTFKQDGLWNENTQILASATLGIRSRRNVYAHLRNTQFFSSKLGWQLNVSHSRRPDEDFFGIGNFSLQDNQSDYLHEENLYHFELISQPLNNLFISAGLSFSDVDIQEGRDPNVPNLSQKFIADDVPGFSGVNMWTLTVKIHQDSRNVTGHPTRGHRATFSYLSSRQSGGNQFGYSTFTVDVQQFFELFYHRVLALRFRGEITEKLGQRDIPFYRLGGLGGTDILRGYRPFRFRDKDVLLAGVEYRWPVHNMIAAYGFFEQGRVFTDIFDDFTFKGFKYSAGGGFRFSSKDGGLAAVFEIAKSQEQLRFNFGLNTELRRF
ncbi:MAG: BamA/TamA family outer membrane protein [bacterium]